MSVQESAEELVPLAESNTGSNSNAPQPGSKSTAIKARLRLRRIDRLDCGWIRVGLDWVRPTPSTALVSGDFHEQRE